MIKKINNNFKIIYIILLIFTFMPLYGFFSMQLDYKINKSHYLDLSTQDVITELPNNGFKATSRKSKQEYVEFVHSYYEDLKIQMYAEDIFSYTNIIIIESPFPASYLYEDKNKYYISTDMLVLLQSSFKSLPCSSDPNFLNSGFVCKDKYTVTYIKQEDTTRRRLNFNPYRKLYVIIEPLQ